MGVDRRGVMYLKACINGTRRRQDHPRLPISAGEIAADVAAVARAGVDAVHLHVKDSESGADTLDGGTLAEVLLLARSAAPGLPIGVTTGAWAEPDPARRLAAIEGWTDRPDFASVNWHEDGAEVVAATLLGRGVQVEAGLWHMDAAASWRRSALRDSCTRILLELPDGLDAKATAQQAERLLAICEPVLTDGSRVVLHGEGTSCWPALRLAHDRGLGGRIGLEDTLVLPDGTPAVDNAQLVLAARAVGSESGR